MERMKKRCNLQILLLLVIVSLSLLGLAATETGGPGAGPGSGWSPVESFTRSDNDTFTVTDNTRNQAIFVPGRPIRYSNTTSIWSYGIVTAYASGTVDFDGVGMDASQDDQMHYGPFERVTVVNIIMPGNASVDDPYSQEIYWQKSEARIVRVTLKADTAPAGSALEGNLEIEGTDVASSEISITAGSTSEFDSGVTLSRSNSVLEFGEKYAITLSQVGSSTPGGNPLTATVSILERGD